MEHNNTNPTPPAEYAGGMILTIYSESGNRHKYAGNPYDCPSKILVVGPGIPAITKIAEWKGAIGLLDRRENLTGRGVFPCVTPYGPRIGKNLMWGAGDAFVASSDSRWGEASGIYGAVSLHDFLIDAQALAALGD